MTGKYGIPYFSNFVSCDIGIIGMNEACLNLLTTDIASRQGLKFSLKAMDFIQDIISEIREETAELFNRLRNDYLKES